MKVKASSQFKRMLVACTAFEICMTRPTRPRRSGDELVHSNGIRRDVFDPFALQMVAFLLSFFSSFPTLTLTAFLQTAQDSFQAKRSCKRGSCLSKVLPSFVVFFADLLKHYRTGLFSTRDDRSKDSDRTSIPSSTAAPEEAR